jgi:uncharacterized membrane protein
MNTTNASRLRPCLAALAVAGAVGLVACGGSTTTITKPAGTTTAATQTKETTPVVTHAAFVKQLDEICRKGNAASRRYADAASKAGDAGDYKRAADELEKGARVANRHSVDGLTPPPPDSAAFARYQAAQRRLATLSKRIIAALRTGDIDEVNRLVELQDAQRKRRTEAAVDLGLQNCGS